MKFGDILIRPAPFAEMHSITTIEQAGLVSFAVHPLYQATEVSTCSISINYTEPGILQVLKTKQSTKS